MESIDNNDNDERSSFEIDEKSLPSDVEIELKMQFEVEQEQQQQLMHDINDFVQQHQLAIDRDLIDAADTATIVRHRLVVVLFL